MVCMFYVSQAHRILILITSLSLEASIRFYRQVKVVFNFLQHNAKNLQIQSEHTSFKKAFPKNYWGSVFDSTSRSTYLQMTLKLFFVFLKPRGIQQLQSEYITRRPNNILSHGKDIFPISSKSNVENIHIFKDPSKVSANQKQVYAVNRKYFCEKMSDELHSKCVRTVHRSASKRTFNHLHTTHEKNFIPIFHQGVPLIFTYHDN